MPVLIVLKKKKKSRLLLFDILSEKIYNLVADFILISPPFILGKHSFNYGCFLLRKNTIKIQFISILLL